MTVWCITMMSIMAVVHMDQFAWPPFAPWLFVWMYICGWCMWQKVFIRAARLYRSKLSDLRKVSLSLAGNFSKKSSHSLQKISAFNLLLIDGGVVRANWTRRQQRNCVTATSLSLGNIQTRSPYSSHFLHETIGFESPRPESWIRLPVPVTSFLGEICDQHKMSLVVNDLKGHLSP